MFNARSETLSTSPVFSKHLGTMRCAAPLDGFFEWTDDKCKSVKSKQPYYVSRSDGQPLWMAGLFASPRSAKTGSGSADPCASGDESFTLITREVDPELAWLHDRMPVILDSQGLQAWLDPKASEPLAALSHRLPTSALRWHPVDKRMSRLDYQESDVALPIKLISEQQRSVASFFGKISTPPVKQEEATAPAVKQEATAPSESSSSSSSSSAAAHPAFRALATSAATASSSSSSSSAAAAAAPSATAALLSPEVTAGTAGACSWVETGRGGKRPAPVSAASIPNKAAAKKPKVIAGAAKSKAAAATSLPIRSMLSATRFASARAEISAMGFSDADRVERALEASEGDIVAAVARLCSDI
jgi:putative SOS response-associated peptidase YedK